MLKRKKAHWKKGISKGHIVAQSYYCLLLVIQTTQAYMFNVNEGIIWCLKKLVIQIWLKLSRLCLSSQSSWIWTIDTTHTVKWLWNRSVILLWPFSRCILVEINILLANWFFFQCNLKYSMNFWIHVTFRSYPVVVF